MTPRTNEAANNAGQLEVPWEMFHHGIADPRVEACAEGKMMGVEGDAAAASSIFVSLGCAMWGQDEGSEPMDPFREIPPTVQPCPPWIGTPALAVQMPRGIFLIA